MKPVHRAVNEGRQTATVPQPQTPAAAEQWTTSDRALIEKHQKIRADLEKLQREQEEGIDIDLPGILYGSAWRDCDLLKFLCLVIADYAQPLRGKLTNHTAVRNTDKATDLCELIAIAHTATGRYSNCCADTLDFWVFPKLTGLAAECTTPNRDLLVHLCTILYDLREQITRLFITNGQSNHGAIVWSQSLVVAELVLHRGGLATDLDKAKGRETPVQRQARQTARRVAVETMRNDYAHALETSRS